MPQRSLNRLKALLLILLAIFFAELIVSGRLYFYVGPRFSWLHVISVGLLILLASTLNAADLSPSAEIHALREAAPIDKWAWLPLVVAAIPIVLGLGFPARPLGAAAAQSREISLTLLQTNALAIQVAPEERTVLDWARAVGSDSAASALNGQKADVIGFVYRDIRFKDNQFMLARFTITCCVADALALGIVVEFQDASLQAQDSWVQVQGVFSAGRFDGRDLPILVADDILPIQPPEQPYLFP